MEENANIAHRLEFILKSRKIKLGEFYAKIGLDNDNHSLYKKGESKPSLEYAQAILKEFPNLNGNWLLTGNGEVWLKNEVSDNETLVSKVQNLENRVDALEKRIG